MKSRSLTLTFTPDEAIHLTKLGMLADAMSPDPGGLFTAEQAGMIRDAGLAIKRAITQPVISVSEAGKKGGKVKSPRKTDANRENARQPRPNRRKKKL